MYEETFKIIEQQSLKQYVLPVIPIAIKEGLKGHFETNNYSGTLEEIAIQVLKDTTNSQEQYDMEIAKFYDSFK
jgi:hypothetical protein